MPNNIFDVFKQINADDTAKGTKNLALCPDFLRAQSTKRGGEVSMGVSSETMQALNNNEVFVVLLAVNRDEYKRLMAE